jgi:hypothetical protein
MKLSFSSNAFELELLEPQLHEVSSAHELPDPDEASKKRTAKMLVLQWAEHKRFELAGALYHTGYTSDD